MTPVLFTEMQTRVREILEDADVTAYQWSATIVDRYINDGLQDFAKRTKCYKRRSDALAEAGTTPDNAFYTLPTDFYEIEEDGEVPGVESDGKRLLPWVGVTLPDDWNEETAEAPDWYLVSDFGVAELRVHPTPTAALTALRVHYTALPATVSGAVAPTGIPSAFHIAAVYYAVAECYRRNFEQGDPAKANEFQAKYEAEVQLCLLQAARKMSSGGAAVPFRNF